ncbi:hypothetical protein KW795_00330 [Candidatus Microgenomates bacterium]|nr:hypothetical protein [Candidatus Microgenomates bacterium]
MIDVMNTEFDIIRERFEIARKIIVVSEEISKGRFASFLDLLAIHGRIPRKDVVKRVDRVLGLTARIVSPDVLDSYLEGFRRGIVISSLQNTNSGHKWALDMFKNSLTVASVKSEFDCFALGIGAFIGARIIPTTEDSQQKILEASAKMIKGDIPIEILFEAISQADFYLRTREVTYQD